MLFRILYNAFITTGWGLIRFLALFSVKWKAFVTTRQLPLPNIPIEDKSNRKLLWMHCSSMGEFEQGKTVLKRMKERDPSLLILVSFFSSSGYSKVNPNQYIDYTCYLPIDTIKQVNKFLDHFEPDSAIFVKYDFWYSMLYALSERKVSFHFISVLLNKDHFLLKFFAKPLFKQVAKAKEIFVQDENSATLLKARGLHNITVVGDSRVDAVSDLPNKEFDDKVIHDFVKGPKKVIVLGSIYENELNLIGALDDAIFNQYKWIIAPHKIDKTSLQMVDAFFKKKNSTLYSSPVDPGKSDVLIIDTIGLLKMIYRHAWIVMIGGGFRKGLHNTLEPAAYAKPVFFGPAYTKFREANELVDQEAFFSISTSKELVHLIDKLENTAYYLTVSKKIEAYIRKNRHASVKIADKLERF